jgi:hypothetical protein
MNDDHPRLQILRRCSWRAIVAPPLATRSSTIADKVLEIDRHSSMATAGVLATAGNGTHPEHSFQYFRRTQLQEMSVDGKCARAQAVAR